MPCRIRNDRTINNILRNICLQEIGILATKERTHESCYAIIGLFGPLVNQTRQYGMKETRMEEEMFKPYQ
jgi:hypothetical protein